MSIFDIFRKKKAREDVMVLDAKERKLIYGVKRKEIFKLSVAELKTLLLLADNEKHSQEDLRDFTKANSCQAVRHIIYQIRKKVSYLEIKTYNRIGYQLLTTINITY